MVFAFAGDSTITNDFPITQIYLHLLLIIFIEQNIRHNLIDIGFGDGIRAEEHAIIDNSFHLLDR